MSKQQDYLDVLKQEHGTTLKVLRAFPADKMDIQPHPKSKTARELAWMFVIEQGFSAKGASEGFDWSVPPAPFPSAPATMSEIIAALIDGHNKVVGIVSSMSDTDLTQTIKFFTGPNQIGDVPKIQFLWMVLHDQIHHRGQFSVYLRMADGKVPSIYGPTLDEPWF